MMAQTTIAPIKQAIVKALRADAALKAALNNEIHEAVAPRDVEYPYLVYDVVWARHDYRWGGDTLETGFDIVVVSDRSEGTRLNSSHRNLSRMPSSA